MKDCTVNTTDYTAKHEGFLGWMKIAISLMLVFILGGCATKAPIVTTEVQRVYVDIPAALLARCQANQPPDKEGYLALPIYEREQEMTLYAISLLKTLSQCNLQLKSIEALQGAAP